MSNTPLVQKEGGKPRYGSANEAFTGDETEEETWPLVAATKSVGKTGDGDLQVAETILALFLQIDSRDELSQHPKTNPKRPPERRFKRHRNYYVNQVNEFRHWWKTSRLLVRLSGGYEYCLDSTNWTAMGRYAVERRRQGKQAFRSMKAIGRGGPSKDFLSNVKPVCENECRVVMSDICLIIFFVSFRERSDCS